jgi:4-amino-4-deoxy-L-arabinose transferase-like glycosyltransferase
MNETSKLKLIKTVTLILILLLTFGLSYYNFGNDGFGNAYYTAAIKSMTLSWQNFFFVSFDPGGFVSVDKPPVALWLQAIFALIFGFHMWCILLPEALAAVASVAIIYHLVNSRFGFFAATSSALILACTPIFVAASRSNNPDAVLVLVLILAAWALTVATERGSLKMLLLAALFIGVGFNTKMLVAYLMVPAFYVTYLFAKGHHLIKKVFHLAAASVVLFAVSFVWVAAVDLTPAADRPYVGSSANNSEFDLVFGYNGLNRVFSNNKSNVVPTRVSYNRPIAAVSYSPTAFSTEQPGEDEEDIPDENSSRDLPGPLRMFDPLLAEQISWFIPLAALGILGAFFYIRTLESEDRYPKYITLLLWGGWALVMLVFFSVYRELTHRYYLNIVAPGVAVLAGVGFSSLLKLYLQQRWSAFLLPLALVLSAGLQIVILNKYPDWQMALWPLSGLTLLAALALSLLMLIIRRWLSPSLTRTLVYLLCAGCLMTLLFTPFCWSFMAVMGHVSGGDPYADPDLLGKSRLWRKTASPGNYSERPPIQRR